MDHTEWITEVSDHETINAIATKADIVPRTFARQVERRNISAENVIAIAIAYGHHPVGALVDTGYLEEKWAQQVDPSRVLQKVSEDQLADEVIRRMKLGIERSSPLNTPVDELAARRKTSTSTEHADDPTIISKGAASPHTPKRTLFDPDELQRVYDAMTDQERSLVDRGKAPDLRTMDQLQAWRDERMQARPELFRGVADSSPREHKEDDDHIS